MFKPQTITEKMLFNTIKLETKTGSGTGFFFQFILIDNKQVPIIVTNKHVINNNQDEIVKFSLHIRENDLPEGKIDIEFITHWFFHEKYDLCFCFFNPLLEQINAKNGKDIFYIPITENLIWNNIKLEELSALEDVVMIGYPIGLWDQKNNLPLFRKGFTSSHPAIDFNEYGIGVVDMACFPGSSGSPLFVLNENGYSDKKGNIVMGTSRLIFLGVLYSGPILDAKGEIVVEDIPTKRVELLHTPMMINLGYYIKASAILDFKPLIEKIITNLTP